MRLSRRDFLLGAAGICVPPAVGFAADYPMQELTWLIYQAPGGTVDLSTRLLQPYLERAGFKVKLEYATGAAGRIARNKLFASKPDGYTLMTEAAPGAIIDEVAYQVPYKAESFPPILGWSKTGFQLCVRMESPIQTFSDLVAETKKRRVTFASIGRGGAQHLQLLLIRQRLGLKFDVVHFDGASPAYAAVLGGHIDVGGGGPGAAMRQAGDRFRFLALTGDAREFPLLEVPTLKEQGYDIPSVNQIFFAMTSPGVPADRITLLSKAFELAHADTEFQERMKKFGTSATLIPAAEITAEHRRQRAYILEFKEELKK